MAPLSLGPRSSSEIACRREDSIPSARVLLVLVGRVHRIVFASGQRRRVTNPPILQLGSTGKGTVNGTGSPKGLDGRAQKLRLYAEREGQRRVRCFRLLAPQAMISLAGQERKNFLLVNRARSVLLSAGKQVTKTTTYLFATVRLGLRARVMRE